MPETSPKNIHLYGVILSGGKGQRMSGKDKGLIHYEQQPLVQHTVDRLNPQVDSLIISANRNLATYHSITPTIVTDHLEGYGGPLVGLLSAMQFIKNNLIDRIQSKGRQTGLTDNPQPWIILSPCDAPLLPTDLVNQLTTKLNQGNPSVQCLIPYDGIRNQPLFSMLMLSTLPILEKAISDGERKAERWLLSLSHIIVDCAHCAEGFTNINTMNELNSRI